MNVLDRLAERPAVAANIGLGLVFTATLAVGVRAVAGYHGNWPFDLAIGTAVCALALARSRSRAWSAATGIAVCISAELVSWRWELPGQPGGAAILALLVLIGSAVRRLPAGTAAAVAAGGAAVVAGTLERYLYFIENDVPCSFAATWLTGFGWGAALGVGLWLRLLDSHRRHAVESVRRDERLALARELHDAAAHHITAIVLQSQAAQIAARKHPEALDDALAGIEAAGTEALDSMRRVIGLLRDGDDAGGLTPGPERLTDLVDRFALRGPAVRLTLPEGTADREWSPEVTATVHRIVQEALTNIGRHATGARSVAVSVAHDRQGVTIEILDDAPPAGSPRFPHSGGYGLVGMRERVEALGGTLSAGPRPVAGWSVRASLPTPVPASGRP